MSSIFGGSKQKSSNRAYDTIKGAVSPVLGDIAKGSQSLSNLLSGNSSGFDTYKDIGGFDAFAEQGSRGITGNAAARGLLRSGSTGKALQEYGNTFQNSFLQNYINTLFGQSNLGLQAGSLLGSVGNVQKSKSKPGIGKFLGNVAAGIATGGASVPASAAKAGLGG